MFRIVKGIVKYVIAPAILLGTAYIMGYQTGKSSAYKSINNMYLQQEKTQGSDFTKNKKTLDDLLKEGK